MHMTKVTLRPFDRVLVVSFCTGLQQQLAHFWFSFKKRHKCNQSSKLGLTVVGSHRPIQQNANMCNHARGDLRSDQRPVSEDIWERNISIFPLFPFKRFLLSHACMSFPAGVHQRGHPGPVQQLDRDPFNLVHGTVVHVRANIFPVVWVMKINYLME